MSLPLEPAAIEAANQLGITTAADAGSLSAAISLKRIADAIAGCPERDGLLDVLLRIGASR